MMRALAFQELQQRFGGCCYGAELSFSALETDSRADLSGKVFLALQGDQFDGHRFCRQAADKGASGLIVSQYQPDIGLPQWCVPDTRIALGQVAFFNRMLFSGSVAAITGNSGKTTVKEMLGAVLAQEAGEEAVLITDGNFNNEIGVPLTLLRLSPQHRYAVIELGANHLGEIAYTADLARPDVGVVLNVTGAHLGEFGSMQNIAQAKGELIEALPASGQAVINLDDAFADDWSRRAGARRIRGYSTRNSGAQAELFARDIKAGAAGYRFQLCHSEVCRPVQLQVPARHNVSNALAAASAACCLGVDLTSIVTGLERFSGVSGRLQTVTGLQQSRIINDSYNANPGSVRAAIDTLTDFAGVRILALGDIGELGDEGPAAHAALGHYAWEQQIDMLFTCGDLARHTSDAFRGESRHFSDPESLVEALKHWLTAETTVLVKGSRSARMERVVTGLTDHRAADESSPAE